MMARNTPAVDDTYGTDGEIHPERVHPRAEVAYEGER